MRSVPPEIIASWPEPNYVNPEERGGPIIIAASICLPIVVVVFLCRIYSRLFISKFFGMDDWLIIPAVICGIGYSCITLVGVKVGWYKHIWDIPPSSLANVRKLVIASNFFGLLNVAFTKLSILCLYLHIAPPSRFQTAVYILLAVTTAWLVALAVTNFVICIPLHAYWEVGFTGKYTCVAEVPYYVAFTSLDLALDTAIYLLPLPVLIPLRMPKRQKVILMGVFGLGILVIVSSAVRLPSLVRVSGSYDLTWQLYDAALWSEVESTVGIFCASAPALKPLIQRFIPSAFGSLVSTRGTKSAEYGTGTGTRRTRAGSYADRRMTEDHGWRGWNQGTTATTAKNGSDVELVHELGFISGMEHIEDGRGRGIG